MLLCRNDAWPSTVDIQSPRYKHAVWQYRPRCFKKVWVSVWYSVFNLHIGGLLTCVSCYCA